MLKEHDYKFFSSEKLCSEAELKQTVSDLKAQGKKIGLCVGAYDLLHPGHIKHLESAKSMCDILVVAVTKDVFVKKRKGANRPIISETLRAYAIASLAFVDYVIIPEYEKATELIKILRPTYYIKGPDYINKTTKGILEEKETIRDVGGSIMFTTDEKFSTSDIINKLSQKAEKPIIIISAGMAGIGKSSVLRILSKRYGFMYLDKDIINDGFLTYIEDDKLVRKMHEKTDPFYNNNIRLQSYIAMFELACVNAENGRDIILDGYFRDKIDMPFIKKYIELLSKSAHVVKVYFKCDKETAKQRITQRYRLDRDHEKLEDFDMFYESHNDATDGWDIILDTAGDMSTNADALYQSIMRFISGNGGRNG